jgi:hypothetical protein
MDLICNKLQDFLKPLAEVWGVIGNKAYLLLGQSIKYHCASANLVFGFNANEFRFLQEFRSDRLWLTEQKYSCQHLIEDI